MIFDTKAQNLESKLTNQKMTQFSEMSKTLFGEILSGCFQVVGLFTKNVAVFCSQLTF